MDKNSDGELQLEELVAVFRQALLAHNPQISPALLEQRLSVIQDHLKTSFAVADTNGSAGIDPDEFLEAIEDPDSPLTIVWEMFSL